ncbi:MAG: LysM peptidoglycan-binding domain-containing protein [Bacteroidota bacterium]|nr:LysM peptidoglycan-binding domain-containing protein [Bacteroidota bacterium]
MRNKFFFNALKWFFYIGIFLITISFSQFFSGCSGSDEVEVTQRDKDSIEVYINLQKSFALYKKALNYNESSNVSSAAEYFESSLNNLNKINYEIILKGENYFWKKDYDELAGSIVEDYLITQSEISQSSLVFDFAKKLTIKYEKVVEVRGDREPLPEGNDVPFIMNSAVEQYIEFFSNTERGRSFIDKCLYRSGKFFPILRKILKYNNAPEELIYLSVQESGLAPTIVSRAGAVGLWQFMPATGSAYGLYQDGYTDDRRDFEKSTDAAARHLKDLYNTFDDWYLAFCAYNAGPGRVRKAISKSGSRDFWALRNYLPGETKNYVPSIIALSFVLRNPEEYGFDDIEYGTPLVYDRVNIKSEITLQKVAELCDSDIETIRELNAEITNDIVPLYDVAYQLRIPHKSFDMFAANYKNAGNIDKSSNYSPEFAGNETAGFIGEITLAQYKVENYQPEDAGNIASTNGRKKVSHEYKKKELLEAIAVYYDVRPVEIRIWNNLAYGSNLKSNQKLDIYVTERKFKSLYGINEEGENTSEVATINSIKPAPVTFENNTDESEDVNVNEDVQSSENNSPETLPEINSSVQNTIENNSTKNNTNETITNEIDTTKNNTNETNSTDNNTNETYTESIPETQEHVNDYSSQPEEPEVQQPSYIEPKAKTVSINNHTSFKTYTVTEGDYLSDIAAEFGVSVSDLLEWNNLESDKIMVGQKLKVQPLNLKPSVHTVTEGENLSLIAKEYGLTLSELKDLNDINTDVIFAGQKLKVTETKTTKKNNTKTSGVKKTYKVKKGETLASIADTFDISIKNLIKWNKLKNDKILVGQILKLYSN